jgi:hypothetical protein
VATPLENSFPAGMKTWVKATLKLQVGNQTSPSLESILWPVLQIILFSIQAV